MGQDKPKKYNKLVRDRIPEIIRLRGGRPVCRKADDKEYWAKLKEKLHEEVEEFVKADTEAEVKEELADVLEVIHAIADHLKCHGNEIEAIRLKKVEERAPSENASSSTKPDPPMSYVANIVTLTRENPNFRKVLFTGKKSQLVAMRVPTGGEIGEEVHAHVEQTLFVLDGEGVAVLDGQSTPVGAGSVIVVTPGTRHNVKNVGAGHLVLYTVYAPPNHIDGRIHATKAAADADMEDEIMGNTIV